MSCPAPAAATPAWGAVDNWMATNRIQAFSTDAQGSGGTASISSCFYLLVKYTEVTPKSFVCKGDSGTNEFKLSDLSVQPASGFELIDAWDFGPADRLVQALQLLVSLPVRAVRLDGLERAGLCRGRGPQPVPGQPCRLGRGPQHLHAGPDQRRASAARPTQAKNGNCLPISWTART